MEHTETIAQRADRLVRQEVFLCVSHVVAALANGEGALENSARLHSRGSEAAALAEMIEQAAELAAPVLDYEEAAREAGWVTNGPQSWLRKATEEECEKFGRGDGNKYRVTAQEACEADNIEPHEREVFEHWAVSSWLAEKLEAKGEKVDRDFASWNVWARTTTGQAISMDVVILAIVADLYKVEG